jgi:putative hydrolase of the HAD superfamily
VAIPDAADITMTRYRTAFLDAGGVLVTPDWTRTAEVLARHGVSVDAASLTAAEPHVKHQLDVAPTVRVTNDEQRGFLYFDLILTRAGVTLDARTDAALAELKAFHDRENAWDRVTDGAVEALRLLREAGLRIVLVSNTNGTIERLFRRVGLLPFLDTIIDSHIEGVEKPDPRLFRIALKRSGSDPHTTIHCGDLYEIDVVGARAAGLSAVLVDSDDLYPHVDCPRVRSLPEFVDELIAGAFD